ncbi:hypothetical protein, partial [Paraburkholderia strydomiana]|uniref:hypothetical protein n=1 Tax=Paraburkholderia strydomiana TaxID=1245417 RepID=UPI0038B8243E
RKYAFVDVTAVVSRWPLSNDRCTAEGGHASVNIRTAAMADLETPGVEGSCLGTATDTHGASRNDG